jgi:hypothetical protein
MAGINEMDPPLCGMALISHNEVSAIDPHVTARRRVHFGQSFLLYPTSGASDDYAYSRHFVDGTKGKILSFTVECGQSFQPSWQEAEEVIREICAGLVAFCLAAQKRAVRATGPSI